jgi:uncharacterized repeat protein (TIGR02543 family)
MFFACLGTSTTYVVTYNANGATSGSVPTDSSIYSSGSTVTVLANIGMLAKTGYSFSGWNIKADASGATYVAGGKLSIMADVTLYALWSTATYAVTYDGNGASSGIVPVDSLSYASGATVKILDNTGSLAKTGYTFLGWNTAADGTGTSRESGATFIIGSTSVVLYAKWLKVDKTIAVESISLNPSSAEIVLYGTKKISTTIQPENATNKRVIWKSSKAVVAKVDSSGTVYGLTSGVAIITVTSADGGFSDSCLVTVKDSRMKSVVINGATFKMGKDSTGWVSVSPMHNVTLSSYCIGKYEVTQLQYAQVMGSNPAYLYGVGDSFPVYNVSWFDAVDFCNELSGIDGLEQVYMVSGNEITADYSKNGWRLPTEAEWEYAAYGNASSYNYEYSGSNNASTVAWYDSNSGSMTHAIGTKKPNEFGIYDMSGNVEEWCWDWDGSYSSEAQVNPLGPSTGVYNNHRIKRGGNWYAPIDYCCTYVRASSSPSFTNRCIGFRVVRSVLF